MPPTFGNGKICYIEVPATDIAKSSDFYKKTFGWNVRTRSDGSVSFDDGVGQVSGVWCTGRAPAGEGGFGLHIMVDDIQKSIALVKQNGCDIVTPVGAHHPEITASFRDPGGNIVGMYEHREK